MVRLSAEIIANNKTYKIEDDLLKIDFSGQDRSDTLLPSWGIKSNSGSLQFIDKTNIANVGLEEKTIQIYLNIYSRKELIGTFEITNVKPDKQNKICQIEFEDALLSLEQVEQRAISVRDKMSAKDFLESIFPGRTGNPKYKIYYADQATETHLKNIKIRYPYIEQGSMWATLAKFCELAMCYAYCDKSGNITMKYNGGR